jgi:FlaG/FlaF family flagellin (archaellin)
MRNESRGQSETIGVVLLTAVFVVLSLTVGFFLLSNFDGSNQTTETVDVHSEINGQDVVIEHRGGTSYDSSNIRVVFQQTSSDDVEYTVNNFSLTSGSNNGTFSPGDRWEKTVDELDGEVQLLVIDTTSGELIYDGTYVVQ